MNRGPSRTKVFRMRSVSKGKAMTRTMTLLFATGALALACSSQVFTSASANVTIGDGGPGAGGSRSGGGASGSSGKSGAGGARSSGGVAGAGAQPTGGSPGSTGGVSAAGGVNAAGGVGAAGGVSAAGGGSSTDSGVITSDGGVAGGVRCTGPNQTFPTFEKGCTNDASCVLVRHTTSCCGSQLFMGINHAELARFQAAESICDAQYPACGCASQGANAEDGTLVEWNNENLIGVSCLNGTCLSHYTGKTFACGTATCTDQQYCSTTTGGPVGSTPSYNCVFLGGCTSCSCVPSTGCVCGEDQGFIKVSCAAP